MEKKVIFGLLGAPRSGKDSVSRFLEDNYQFKSIAFADFIKIEFGISKEAFEEAKNTPQIDELRTELWKFSATKKAEDPWYFIKKAMEFAHNNVESIVVNDIRTPDELHAVFTYIPNKVPFRRVYLVERAGIPTFDDNDMLIESKLSHGIIEEYAKYHTYNDESAVKNIYNTGNIENFNNYLHNFFDSELK